jgi:hypothetical protein
MGVCAFRIVIGGAPPTEMKPRLIRCLDAIGASYLVSSRTSIYAQIGIANNRGAMKTGLSVTDTSLLRGVAGISVVFSHSDESTCKRRQT